MAQRGRLNQQRRHRQRLGKRLLSKRTPNQNVLKCNSAVSSSNTFQEHACSRNDVPIQMCDKSTASHTSDPERLYADMQSHRTWTLLRSIFACFQNHCLRSFLGIPPAFILTAPNTVVLQRACYSRCYRSVPKRGLPLLRSARPPLAQPCIYLRSIAAYEKY